MAQPLQVSTSYKQIAAIALPISFALLVPQLNLIINSIFLGHLSEQALATGSITGVYYLIFAAIGIGLNNGLQAFISRKAGENNPAAIGAIFQNGVFIALAIALLGIVLTYSVAPFIFKAAIQSPTVYADAVSFINIRVIGLPFLFIYQMRNALLVGINQSRLLVIGTTSEAVTNVVLDYGLIFGNLGLPAMGFNGAAVASVIAEAVGMFAIFLMVQYQGISKQFSLFKNFRFNKGITLTILQLSGPLIFQMAISIISWFFFYLLIEHEGPRALAISNTMRNVFGFFGVAGWAFAATANSMVSNVIGQGRSDEVMGVLFKITRLSTAVALVVCGLLNLFPATYFSVFGQSDAFVAEGQPVLRVVSVAIILLSAGTVWLSGVTGTGNSKITFLIEAVAIVVYCLYVWATLHVLKLGIVWGWVSELLYWTLMLSVSVLYLRSGKWKGKGAIR